MKYNIEKILKDRRVVPMGRYSENAVTILLEGKAGEETVIFEKRSHKLKKQPGDICLPGGRMDLNESAMEAAKREVMEELNIKENDLNYIGAMNYFISPYRTIIYPFVARLNPCEIKVNEDEVDKILRVPLEFFVESKPMLYELEHGPYLKDDFPYELIEGGRNYKFSRGKQSEYFYTYGSDVIWGFTARIIKEFVDIIKQG
jgi:8-oxo-dGTP pyrophosphatase MutT (NUDIX family)